MSTASSSGSRTSASIPQHACPSASAPRSRFLFVPSTLCAAETLCEGITYLYGFSDPGSGIAVVAGPLRAASLEDARIRLQAQLGSTGHAVKVLGQMEEQETGVKGKGKASAQASEGFLLSFVGSRPVLVASEADIPTSLIQYTPPNRHQLQFLALVPLPLDLNSFSSVDDAAAKGSAEKAQTEEQILGQKLKQSRGLDFSAGDSPGVGCADLEQVVRWINLAPHLVSLLSPTPPTSRRSLTISPFVHSILSPPLLALSLSARCLLALTNYSLPAFLPGLGGMALKDLSATLQQVDTRLSQGRRWPSQFALIRRTLEASARGEGGEGTEEARGRAHYIQFYNTMWLIANDMIVGSALTSFLCDNSEYLGHNLGRLTQTYTIDVLRDLLVWLNSWPGGVKLNLELASIFCDGFLWGTALWEDVVLRPLLPHLPTIIYLLGLSGLLGTTMFFSLASDLLSLLTTHIFFFYLMATSLFRWHLSMLGALFNIFRGKKYNVLRKRVEPATYEVDQLLLGTILFTLAAFLFPTVLAFYLAFAASRLSIVVMHAAMETGLAFMNHFPLFAVMLRFKDPARLPGGLQFELQSSTSNAETPLLRMRNNPIHLAGIFFQHLQLSRRLASHYSPIYLLGRLLTGQVISPIPRVRLRLDVASSGN